MNQIVENISVDQFFKLNDVDRYSMLFNWLKPKNSFRGVLMNENNLTYGNILVLKESLTEPSITSYFDIYRICYNQTPEEFLKGTIIEFAQSNRYIVNFIKQLMHREKQLLESEPDAKWIQAGGERMKVFGDKSVLIQLGEQFGKSPREISEWKYSEVFMCVYFNHLQNSINKNYYKLK